MKKIRMIIDLDVALHGTAKKITTDPDHRWIELLGQVRSLKALLDAKTEHIFTLQGRVAELEKKDADWQNVVNMQEGVLQLRQNIINEREGRIKELEKRMGV